MFLQPTSQKLLSLQPPQTELYVSGALMIRHLQTRLGGNHCGCSDLMSPRVFVLMCVRASETGANRKDEIIYESDSIAARVSICYDK